MVAVSAIKTIDDDEIITGTVSLPLSKSYKEQVMNKIELKLFKR
jgi:hypothetical protein